MPVACGPIMHITIAREPDASERRVAIVPKGAATLVASGHTVAVTAGAGDAAGFSDHDYAEAGATIGAPASTDLLVAVGPLTANDCSGASRVIAMLDPLGNPDEMQRFAQAGIETYAMEFVPRTTLAQSMDALSSQATVAGYEAVLLAASASPRFFPMLMTAAGTIRPARVLVLGAGVAGLQAIATARRLGAIVSGYDIRPAAREQVESLGASFVGGPVIEDAETSGGYASEVDEATRAAQQEALAAAVAAADVVITTAQVPGRAAPRLISAAMVDTMKPGAVIIDLAASSGGNCELTKADEIVSHGSIRIHGPTDLAARTAGDASEMYSRNVIALIDYLFGEDGHADEPEDEIAVGSRITRDGAIVDDRVRAALEGQS
jgi:NAD(P) transhydrogenase subunit alpha